ncbi:putative surface protease GP63 [Trypanosoma cruzi]|nr:putative surface protease GP63 [Trypanosoma cruzi]
MESNRGDERCGRHTPRAHHMRRGQQPGMHRTPHTTHNTHSNPRQQAHTHTQPCRSTNTQMEEGEANRSGTQGSTARTCGESGPSCLHPSRRVRTHTREGAAHTATQKQSNNRKRRSPHTTWIVGPREVQPIFTTKTVQLP